MLVSRTMQAIIARDRLAPIDGLALDMVFDVIGAQILNHSATLARPGGALVSIAEPPRVPPGRLRPLVGAIYPLEKAPAAFEPIHRSCGKVIIRLIGAGK